MPGMKTSRSRLLTSHLALLLVILAVALTLRFRWLASIEHNVDHAYPVWQALQTLQHGTLPLVGQGTSVLFANPPLTGYLYLPVAVLTRSPLGAYVLVIALNTLGVWCCYRAVRAVLGVRAGLIAAWLMAVNPWVIEYSRTSWVQSLLPFLTCAVAWLLWPVLTGQAARPTRRLILALGMLAALAHTYLLAYFMLAPVGLLLVIFRRRVPLRGLVIGGLIFSALALPYGVGLIAQSDTVRDRLTDFTDGQSRLTTEAAESAVRLVTGADYALARGTTAPAGDSARRHALSQITHGLLVGCLGLGLARLAHGLRRAPGPDRQTARNAGLILGVWLGVPVLAMSYTSNPVHPFYQLLTLPAGYALAAWGLAWLSDRGRLLRAGVGIFLALFGLLMSVNHARYSQETAAHPGAHDLYALPVGVGVRLGQQINAALPPGGMIYAAPEDWILSSFAGRVVRGVRDTRAPALTVLPPNGGLYLTMTDALPLRADMTARLPLADGSTIMLYRLPRADDPAVLAGVTRFDPPIPSQQGLTLIGYTLTARLEQAAQTHVDLITYWRVDSVTPEAQARIYAPFVHVYDGQARVINAGGEGLPGAGWGAGELHLHQMTFTVPLPPPFTLLLGQYDGLHNANIVFLPPGEAPGTTAAIPVGAE